MFLDISPLKKSRDFCYLYFGQLISLAGSYITFVTGPYQIYQLTHSTLLVGAIGIAELIPLLGAALFGGALADRYERKKLLIYTEIGMALLPLLLYWNSLLPHPSVLLIFVSNVFFSLLNGIHRPALDGMTPLLVQKEDLKAVGALHTLNFSVCSIAGPAVGGMIISYYGVPIAYLIDFLSYLFCLLLLLRVKISVVPEPIDSSILSSIKEGFYFAKSRQELLGSYLVDIIAMIFGMPNALFPAIAEHFGGASVLGFFYAAPSVGALLISLFSGWSKKIKRYGVAISASAFAWGVSIIGFGLSKQLWFALFFLMLAGLFDAISGIFRSTLWNETIPSDFRGRMAGIEMISYMAGPMLGNAEAGLVAAIGGVTVSVVSGGVLCVVGVIACMLWLPKFRKFTS